jgi:DNA-binding NtrC family response regulator
MSTDGALGVGLSARSVATRGSAPRSRAGDRDGLTAIDRDALTRIVRLAIREAERAALLEILARVRGDRIEAARALRLSDAMLRARLAACGIDDEQRLWRPATG